LQNWATEHAFQLYTYSLRPFSRGGGMQNVLQAFIGLIEEDISKVAGFLRDYNFTYIYKLSSLEPPDLWKIKIVKNEQ